MGTVRTVRAAFLAAWMMVVLSTAPVVSAVMGTDGMPVGTAPWILQPATGAGPDAKPWGDIPLTLVHFNGLRLDPRTNQPVVELINEENTRILRIWIGINEALAIEMEHKRIIPPRPMTHDLMVNIIKGLGAKLNQIVIHDLRENTFFAYLSLNLSGQDYTVDSRPSDAIALSLRTGAPIYVASRILAEQGVAVAPKPPAQELKELLAADMQDLTPELASSFGLAHTGGVLVAGVDPEGKAAAAGLRRGDVILKAAGHPVEDMAGLAIQIKELAGKGPLRLTVHREGKSVEVTLRP